MKNTVIIISGLVAAYGIYQKLRPKEEKDKMSAAQKTGSNAAIFLGGLGVIFGLTAIK